MNCQFKPKIGPFLQNTIIKEGAVKDPQYGIMSLEARDMGRPKKNFYEGDEGRAIQRWMRDLDWRDRNDIQNLEEPCGSARPPDQEDEDWEEKLYQR